MQIVYSNPWFRVEREGKMHRVVNEAPCGVVMVVRTEGGDMLAGLHRRFATGDDASLELPRGNAVAGETPEHAAVRELREETCLSFAADAFRDLGVVHADSGLIADNVHVMLAEIAGPLPLRDGHDDEFSRLMWMAAGLIAERSTDALTLAAMARTAACAGIATEVSPSAPDGGIEGVGKRMRYTTSDGRTHEYFIRKRQI